MPYFDAYCLDDFQFDIAESATKIISEHGPMDLPTLVSHLEQTGEWETLVSEEVAEALNAAYENADTSVVLTDGKYSVSW